MVGQERSKWLRDERDEDWGAKSGIDSYFSADEGVKQQSGSVIRKESTSKAILSGSNCQLGYSNMMAGSSLFKLDNGPSTQELVGLNMDERKRRRETDTNELMEVEGGQVTSVSEPALSRRDLAASSPEFLAKLAEQASQSK
ncbi:hypothetical protein ACET3Z_026647 [Daucus carota]